MEDNHNQSVSPKKPRRKVDKETVLRCYDAKRIKVIDLTDVLAKFPELFSLLPMDPESIKETDLDPNEAFVSQPVFPQNKKAFGNAFSRPKVIIPKSPFTNSRFSDDATLRVWYYIDEQDAVQGPFTSIEMDNWFDQGYFFNELLIRFNNNNQFNKLIDLFGKIQANTPNPHFHHQALNPTSLSRNASEPTKTNKDEDGPKLGLPQVFSQIQPEQQLQQKPNSKRGSKRIAADENAEMMPKNIWESFIDKNKQEEGGAPNEKQDSPHKDDGKRGFEHKQLSRNVTNDNKYPDSVDSAEKKPSKQYEAKKEFGRPPRGLERNSQQQQQQQTKKDDRSHDTDKKADEHLQTHKAQNDQGPKKSFHNRQMSREEEQPGHHKKIQQSYSREYKPKEENSKQKGEEKHKPEEDLNRKNTPQDNTKQKETKEKDEVKTKPEAHEDTKNTEEVEDVDWIETGNKNPKHKNKKKRGNNRRESIEDPSTSKDTEHAHPQKSGKFTVVFEPKTTSQEPKAVVQELKQSEKQSETTEKSANKNSKAKFMTWGEKEGKAEVNLQVQTSEAKEENHFPSLSDTLKMNSKDVKQFKAATSAGLKKGASPAITESRFEKLFQENSPSTPGDKAFPTLGNESAGAKKETTPAFTKAKYKPMPQLQKKAPEVWDKNTTGEGNKQKGDGSANPKYDNDFPSL